MDHAECSPGDLSARCLDAHQLKQAAAIAALADVPAGAVIGIGSGTTVAAFVEELAARGPMIAGAVPASEATAQALRHHGLQIVSLNDVETLDLYFDGADEIDPRLRLIKGRGGAMTREKVLAGAALTFVCIADASKVVDALGAAPLPLEVLPMARALVLSRLLKMGATSSVVRAGLTDNGNETIDVRGLDISSPEDLEVELESLPGVVGSGLFARRRADRAYVAGPNRVLRLEGDRQD
jgi:ribose 5-phosphate isomerase A